ncbi:MAG: hypothetical protein KKF57_05875 [Firmicutes bacterium]|nr:hypothetical protein [Bacillota bacterium]
MKIKKRYIMFSVLILLVLYVVHLNGYRLTEESAIRNSYPNQSGEVVYEKEFDQKKVVIWDAGTAKYVKLINKDWGILHRATVISGIGGTTLDEKMKFNWNSTLKEDKYYDTLFAVEVLDTKIVKVIVSNERNNEKALSLDEAKEQSTMYVEMDVINGYAAHYRYLHTSDVGAFIFRGLDSEGNVLSIQ